MNYHKMTTDYACGVDLHSREMYICVTDRDGNVHLHKNIKGNNLDYFLKLITPWQGNITVACESTFNWYFLSDFCDEYGIPFVIGHALYMKHIHGGKAKNDRIDSKKIAYLLRSNLLPLSYAYPPHLRSCRDLMRRRGHLVRHRGELLAHLSILGYQYNMVITEAEKRPKNRSELLKKFSFDINTYKNAEADLRVIAYLDEVISDLELDIRQFALKEARTSFQIIKTIPGSGDIISLSVLYEIDDINRFSSVKDFASYARLVKCCAESGGKNYGFIGVKIGNPHLKWAFSEMALYAQIHDKYIKAYFKEVLLQRWDKGKAYSCLAHKLGRCVYFMLKRGTVFDLDKFFTGHSYKKNAGVRLSPEA